MTGQGYTIPIDFPELARKIAADLLDGELIEAHEQRLVQRQIYDSLVEDHRNFWQANEDSYKEEGHAAKIERNGKTERGR